MITRNIIQLWYRPKMKFEIPPINPQVEFTFAQVAFTPSHKLAAASLIQFSGRGKIQSALWYVVERPACIQWIPDNEATYVISSSPLSALFRDAGWQACQGDRGINPAAWSLTQVLCRESPFTCAERNGACNCIPTNFLSFIFFRKLLKSLYGSSDSSERSNHE